MDIALQCGITILSGIGLWVSIFMLRRWSLANRGLLAEASVVSEPEGSLFFGIPNSALGIAYYIGLIFAVWLLPQLRLIVAFIASLVLLVSILLASSLIRKRLSCKNCWTAHIVNFVIFLLAMLLVTR